MDYGALLTESKWNLLKELSTKEQTPTDLAKKTKTSLANVSQQLRLLEAYGIVKKERKENNKQPGKPKTIYVIAKKVNYLISISEDHAIKKELNLDYFQKAMINIPILESNENSYFIEKFFFTNEEVVKKCDFVGLVKSENDTIELLLITKDIETIREKYSNQKITNLEGKKKTIVCWTHNIQEIEIGLKTENEHFIYLANNYNIILDKNDTNKKIKLAKLTK